MVFKLIAVNVLLPVGAEEQHQTIAVKQTTFADDLTVIGFQTAKHIMIPSRVRVR